MPQGSILGPILFNIFISDLFLVIKDVDFGSYANDTIYQSGINTIYQSGRTVDNVNNGLKVSAEKRFQWFSNNQMKGNTDQCHLIMSTNNATELQIGDSSIKTSNCEKLLGVKIDYKLTFDEHVNSLCKKANSKLRALARTTPYMNIEKRKLLMNSFFNAQFNYCPLIWMLHTRCNNNKIKHLHERCLRLTYCDKKSSYEELLEKNGSVSIHHKNIQSLAIEMYKVKNEIAPMITANVFTRMPENHYNFRHRSDFIVPFARTVYHGTESISYLGPKIWDIVPSELKKAQSLNGFKKSIRKWAPDNCPCRLCKRYVNGVGLFFILH